MLLILDHPKAVTLGGEKRKRAGKGKGAGDRRRRGWAGGKRKKSRSQDVGGVREAALQ